MAKKYAFRGYTLTDDYGSLSVDRTRIVFADGDHGADPIGDGTFRMVPSGDIVDFAERCRRLEKKQQR